ncbi:MAG: hypothetical protein ACR2LL_10375 [Nitrosopumilus sp.]|uniref:hypothetical protein n=1 Tax=Nitrosopumilus sp. TaxID=2024843 RepID=UPI0029319118|nr:hypothetical protein [Nitrosopumilus sp.]
MKKVKPVKQKVIPTYILFSKTAMFQDYKACPVCGQNDIPFKKGICPKCSKQVCDVQYVRNPREYVKSNHGNIKMGIKRHIRGLMGCEVSNMAKQ